MPIGVMPAIDLTAFVMSRPPVGHVIVQQIAATMTDDSRRRGDHSVARWALIHTRRRRS